jgi:hypothetical protein
MSHIMRHINKLQATLNKQKQLLNYMENEGKRRDNTSTFEIQK